MPPLFRKWKFKPMRAAILILSVSLLSGCGFLGFPGVYKINVEQGNLVDKEMVDQLEPGMSRRQVQFILGTPLVEDTFDQARWDYPYVISHGDDVIRKARMAVYFDGDSLVDVTGDYRPAWASEGEAAPDYSKKEDEAEAAARDNPEYE